MDLSCVIPGLCFHLELLHFSAKVQQPSGTLQCYLCAVSSTPEQPSFKLCNKWYVAACLPLLCQLLSSERTARPDCKSPCVSTRADEGLAVQAAAGSGWWVCRPRAISSSTGNIWGIVGVFTLRSPAAWEGIIPMSVLLLRRGKGLSVGVFGDELGLYAVSLPPAFC